jgi:hypothetical protein
MQSEVKSLVIGVVERALIRYLEDVEADKISLLPEQHVKAGEKPVVVVEEAAIPAK